MFEDIRSLIEHFEEKNDLIRIKKEIDPKFELAAISKKLDGKSPVLFENVKNRKVVLGFFGTRERIASSLDVDIRKLRDYILKAVENPKPVKIVEDAPVKENVIKNFDLRDLPIPTHYEKDAGAYITCGVIIAKDPETGVRNASYHRMLLKDKDTLGVLINGWRDLMKYYRKAEERDEPLEIAVCIGLDPSTLFAAAATGVPIEVDEFEIASSLLGKHMELVKCENVDIEVPANTEIVLEGEILPKVREPEGPFADFTGIYDIRRDNPVIKIKGIMHRDDPIYQDILPISREHLLLGAVPREPVMYKALKMNVNVLDVHLTLGSCGRFTAVISIKKEGECEGRDAILTALSTQRDLKHVVVVDDDIDIFDERDVEWAVTTRYQSDKDTIMIKDLSGSLDPSGRIDSRKLGIITAKMGIDATKSFEEGAMRSYEKPKIPFEIDLREYMEDV
jgi:2,5-furandicarboxylate decarboxylase 1